MNEQDFWEQVVKTDSCWLWMGALDRWGYGKSCGTGAHRVSWTLAVGPVPSGSFVCHHCDVPHCVNPEHLYIGNQRTNMDDMVRRGHSTRGDRNPNSRLNFEQAEEMRTLRASGEWTYQKLSERFGVGKTQVARICTGKHWRP